MKNKLLESLIQVSESMEKKFDYEKAKTYEEIIGDCQNEVELNECLNSQRVHPWFKHLVLKQFFHIN
jgi:hypothetical protein